MLVRAAYEGQPRKFNYQMQWIAQANAERMLCAIPLEK